jgi:hypothetical protein
MDHEAYNRLPTIEEADQGFAPITRPEIFEKLGPLLDSYRDYDLCLVHRHVLLQPGERMVATGLITLPELTAPGGRVYPSAWNADGLAFEWQRLGATERPIDPPPPELLQEFLNIVGPRSVLGLSTAVDRPRPGNVWLEHIESSQRRHIRRSTPLTAVESEGVYQSCWVTSPNPAQTLICCVVCVASRH